MRPLDNMPRCLRRETRVGALQGGPDADTRPLGAPRRVSGKWRGCVHVSGGNDRRSTQREACALRDAAREQLATKCLAFAAAAVTKGGPRGHRPARGALCPLPQTPPSGRHPESRNRVSHTRHDRHGDGRGRRTLLAKGRRKPIVNSHRPCGRKASRALSPRAGGDGAGLTSSGKDQFAPGDFTPKTAMT